MSETAKFVQMMDRFFDCLNVNSFNKGKQRRKEFQDPYRSGRDFRLKVCFFFSSLILYAMINFADIYTISIQWLEDEFLGYLQKWEHSVMAQPQIYTKDKNNMLLSKETRYGIEVTGEYNCA